MVVDTGVLVAGLYWWNELHQCLRAWQQGLFQLASQAKTVIARDTDLTDLEKPFGIEIVTPRQFLARLPRRTRRPLG